MDVFLARAQVLLEQSRYDLAEKELHQALGANPGLAMAHALLAICHVEREKYDDATREAREAIALEPDLPYVHYVHALVLHRRRRNDEALRALSEALALDPDNPNFHGLAAQIHLDERRWTQALEEADAGLRLDAGDVHCTNLRAAALVQLGRRDEAGVTMEGALARDPDNAVSHANQGWTLLHAGDPKKAMDHFRESLRLDPTSDWAKAGIVEALKARNVVYGLMLRYFLFMSRLGSGAQWGLIVGGYIGNRILVKLANSSPALAPWIWPIVASYAAFCVMTWIAYPLFNLFLRLHPVGKYALSDDQRRGANWVGSCLFLALACLVGWLGFNVPLANIGALTFGFLLLPLSGTFGCAPGWPRGLMAGYTALLFAAQVGFVAVVLLGIGTDDAGHGIAGMLIQLFIWGCILSGWVVNALMRVRPRR
jgi:tetratricopeptide (TPR) repeat protein